MPKTASRTRASPRIQRKAAAGPKSAQRIDDIVRAARDVFSDRGYDAATTIEIAERLGISEATIFTYFGGKRELCVRVIEDWYDEIVGRIEAHMPRGASVRTRLDFIVRAHLTLFLVQGTGMCALVLSEGRAKGQPLGDRLVPLQRRYTAPLMALLAEGQASGSIRSDVPLALLRSLVYGPMEHLLWETIAVPRAAKAPMDVDPIADDLVELLWSTLRKPGSELAALRRMRGELVALTERQGVPAASTGVRRGR